MNSIWLSSRSSAAHPDGARVSADGLKSVGRGQDAAVLAAYDFREPVQSSMSVAAKAGC